MSRNGSKRETYDLNKMLQDCEHLGKENGLDIYLLKQRVHINDEKNKIKIVHIGRENSFPTKNILLIGETGAGKTTLLNALCNHLFAVKFEDSYRMKLFAREESCDGKEFYESMTEMITGYLFYAEPFMQYSFNVLIIDTPGFNDTRGFSQQKNIINQMNTFLSKEEYGIVDLHCLGFVIKANFNRTLGYFGSMIDECLRSFGKDTEKVTYILKTFAVDKDNDVSAMFKDAWDINTENEFNFDNANLYESNKGELDSLGITVDESEIEWRRRRWNSQTKECQTFFNVLSATPSVSLRLTRAALKEKYYLEQAKSNLSEKIESTLTTIVAGRKNREMLNDYRTRMDENKIWRGKEAVIERNQVPVSQDARWYQFLPHVHNCKTCKKTCSYICHIWIPCPLNIPSCIVCKCMESDHEKADYFIKETLTIRNVTDEDMIAKFQKSESAKVAAGIAIENLKEEENILKKAIAIMVKYICLQLERLNEISVRTTSQSPTDILDKIIQSNKYFTKFTEEECNAFLQDVSLIAEDIEVNKDDWIRELEQTMSMSMQNSLVQTSRAVITTASNAAVKLISYKNRSSSMFL